MATALKIFRADFPIVYFSSIKASFSQLPWDYCFVKLGDPTENFFFGALIVTSCKNSITKPYARGYFQQVLHTLQERMTIYTSSTGKMEALGALLSCTPGNLCMDVMFVGHHDSGGLVSRRAPTSGWCSRASALPGTHILPEGLVRAN